MEDFRLAPPPKWAIALVSLLLLGVVVPSNAVPLLDQSFTAPANLGGVINECCTFIAQTYTAGLSGTLAGVNIDVQSSSSFPLHVAVHRVTGGVPNSLPVGEITLSSSSAPLSLFIAFPEVIEQVAGAQYSIAVNYVGAPPPGPGQSQGVWVGAFGNVYTGGDLLASLDGTSWFQFGDDDLHFQTFVKPIPQPTMLFLFGTAAGLGLALWRQRRRK